MECSSISLSFLMFISDSVLISLFLLQVHINFKNEELETNYANINEYCQLLIDM
jgi:hypothetical protein